MCVMFIFIFRFIYFMSSCLYQRYWLQRRTEPIARLFREGRGEPTIGSKIAVAPWCRRVPGLSFYFTELVYYCLKISVHEFYVKTLDYQLYSFRSISISSSLSPVGGERVENASNRRVPNPCGYRRYRQALREYFSPKLFQGLSFRGAPFFREKLAPSRIRFWPESGPEDARSLE